MVYKALATTLSLFQSTLPRGERRNHSKSRVSHIQFQSTLPRGERLSAPNTVESTTLISIHAPARGATFSRICNFLHIQISIHAPARGATILIYFSFFFSKNFNPRSREGSDDRFQKPWTETVNFNPRSREGSDTSGTWANQIRLLFQSTLPRGERLCI